MIVTWNGWSELKRCLTSVVPQVLTGDPPALNPPTLNPPTLTQPGGSPPQVEVVVVDNGSTDETREQVRAQFPGVRLLERQANDGFAVACQQGIDATQAPWVLTLNNDAILEPDALHQLRTHLSGLPAQAGMLQPRIVFRDRPGLLNSTGVLMLPGGCPMDRDFERPVADGPPSGEIFAITAGAALWRRSMLEAVRLPTGSLDATFYMYFEDVDLGWRARLAGWSAYYVNSVTVRHAFQASSSTRGPQFVLAHCARNRIRCLLKNASWRYIARSSRRTAGEFLWLMRSQGGQALKQWFDAVGDGLRQRRTVARLAKVPRREIEQRWFGAAPSPQGDAEA